MKQAYLSEWAGKPLVSYLARAGYNINFIRQNNYVDPRISTHADLFMCQFGLWDEAGLFFGDWGLSIRRISSITPFARAISSSI